MSHTHTLLTDSDNNAYDVFISHADQSAFSQIPAGFFELARKMGGDLIYNRCMYKSSELYHLFKEAFPEQEAFIVSMTRNGHQFFCFKNVDGSYIGLDLFSIDAKKSDLKTDHHIFISGDKEEFIKLISTVYGGTKIYPEGGIIFDYDQSSFKDILKREHKSSASELRQTVINSILDHVPHKHSIQKPTAKTPKFENIRMKDSTSKAAPIEDNSSPDEKSGFRPRK